MSPESTSIAEKPSVTQSVDVESIPEPIVVTSNEELEGFHTVRAIVRSVIATKRVVMRDAQSYCAILLDDNNRKPICRLRFNNTQKLKLGIFNAKREEEQIALESVDDIYTHADKILATVNTYLETPGNSG